MPTSATSTQRPSPPGRVPAPDPESHRRFGTAPLPRVADWFAWLGGLGLGASAAFALSQDSLRSVTSMTGFLDAVGRLSGMVGTYLLLAMLLLMARIPWLERTVGQDRLTRWHRRIGAWPVVLIALHVVTLLFGYAAAAKTNVVNQAVTFLQHYPGMLMAFVGFGLLLLATTFSIPQIRRRLRYETWWTIHLAFYLAVALSFAHQVRTGIIFLGHPMTIAVWTRIFAAVASVLVLSRVVRPIVANLRYRLRVTSVKEVSPGVFALVMQGRHLDRLSVSGGQFFQWRFLAPGLLVHSHPYSLSALPSPPYLRMTVKSLGDQSSALARLRPGTRVFIEGPYGVFTRHQITAPAVTLIGAGVGVTPLRALLEDLPDDVPVTVLLRASTPEDLVHADEVRALVEERQGSFHTIVGPRQRTRLDRATLNRLAPHVRDSDVYICGPAGFTADVANAAASLGVPTSRIHQEKFSF
jgi:predicted ferric reductase